MHVSATLPVVVFALACALGSCATHQEIRVSTKPTTLPAIALPTVDADCGGHPAVVRPAGILLACADGSFTLQDITWSSYAATSAQGSAVMHANTCRPNCANGSYRDYPATIALGGLAYSDGTTSFTEVTQHYAGVGPDGRSVASYPIQ